MKRIIFILIILLSVSTIFAGAAKEKTDTVATVDEIVTIKVGVPPSPPALPILYMIEENLLGDNIKIEMDIWKGPEQLIAMVQSNEHDMFAFPLTVIAKLYNRGVPVRLMNVNTWGVTYFLTSDPNFKSWADLEGKTVYIPLKTSPPDALTQFFINEAGVKNVELIYASNAEVTQLVSSGKAKYATQIEPHVSATLSKNPDVRRALAFEDEWQRVTGTDTRIPNAGFGAKKNFIDRYPEITAKFNDAYSKGVEWVNANPEEAGLLAEKYLKLNSMLVTKAIPNMGLFFKSATDADAELMRFWNLLNDFDKTMIGGQLPDSGIYYGTN